MWRIWKWKARIYWDDHRAEILENEANDRPESSWEIPPKASLNFITLTLNKQNWPARANPTGEHRRISNKIFKTIKRLTWGRTQRIPRKIYRFACLKDQIDAQWTEDEGDRGEVWEDGERV